jgi:undecaprenyl-diphosphatase
VSVDLFHALFLGVVQGLTEFLPISSSGHLALIPQLLHWPSAEEKFGLAFDVALHVGTLAAVLWYFRGAWAGLVRAFFSDAPELADERRLSRAIVIACIPGALAGALLEKKAETVFRSPVQIAVLMIGMGLVMGIVDRLSRRRRTLEEIRWTDALAIGIAQAAALAPGVSRSGVTITAGRLAGFDRADSARFSFLLSAPITAGAALFALRHGVSGTPAIIVAAGVLSSFFVGWATIAALLAYVRRYSLDVFVAYRILFGAVVLALFLRR